MILCLFIFLLIFNSSGFTSTNIQKQKFQKLSKIFEKESFIYLVNQDIIPVAY